MNQTGKKDRERPKRKRRTAESARREILDAAKQRLVDEGPDGLRLKAIAEDLGISHSSILHHFGSRDGLLTALSEDAFDALAQDLRKRISEPTKGDPSIDFFEKVAETLGQEGYGRLLAWQLMAGNLPARASVGMTVLGPDGSGGLLDGMARALHEMRVSRAQGYKEPEPDLGETRLILVMAACTLLGEAIAGDVLVRSAGLGRSPEERKEFRAWFAKQSERMVFPALKSHRENPPTYPGGKDE